MIRFIKDEPFLAPMAFCTVIAAIAVIVCLVAAIANPDTERRCNNGYVYVENDKTHGCVSEQVWKESQS